MRDIIKIVESHGMGYRRVIPRDLFNEANLLKCYGRLYIVLSQYFGGDRPIEMVEDGGPFDIVQDSDGGLTIANVSLMVRGKRVNLSRPVNSREEWPLFVTPDWENGEDGDIFDVFDGSGNLSPEMVAFLKGE